MKQQRAFGTWSSPISARMLAGGVRSAPHRQKSSPQREDRYQSSLVGEGRIALSVTVVFAHALEHVGRR